MCVCVCVCVSCLHHTHCVWCRTAHSTTQPVIQAGFIQMPLKVDEISSQNHLWTKLVQWKPVETFPVSNQRRFTAKPLNWTLSFKFSTNMQCNLYGCVAKTSLITKHTVDERGLQRKQFLSIICHNGITSNPRSGQKPRWTRSHDEAGQ